MSIKIAYLIACETSIQDAATGMWTYVRNFSMITIPKDQEQFVASFNIVGKLLDVDSEEVDALVSIVDQKGNVFRSVNVKGTIQPGDVEVTTHFELVGFQEPGKYYINITVNGKKLRDDKRFYFDVVKENA